MPTAIPTPPSLAHETLEDILFLARIGDLSELKDLLQELNGQSPSFYATLSGATGPTSGNSVAHLAAANGHVHVLRFVHELESTSDFSTSASSDDHDGERLSGSLLTRPNDSGSTPLHYAAINGASGTANFILDSFSEEQKAEKDTLLGWKNLAGRSALSEAESAGKEEMVSLLLRAADGGEERGPEEDGQGNPKAREAAPRAETGMEDFTQHAGNIKLDEG